MAASTAGTNPPVSATTITATRNSSTSLVRLRLLCRLVSTRVSSVGSAAASTYPAICRRGVIATPAHLRVRHDVHVDVARAADGPGPDARPGEQGGQPGPAAGAEHELGRVLRAGEGEQGVG